MPLPIYSTMFIMFFAILFTRLNHPLAMGATLFIQTILICLSAGSSLTSVWFPYILFLIFLGAMLVLFIYVASLAPNESFHLSMVALISSGATAAVMMLLMVLNSFTMGTSVIYIEESSFSPLSAFNEPASLLSMIYSSATVGLTLYVILYLLLTLIIVVKIASSFFGPLRVS